MNHIKEAIEQIRNGGMVVVTDDEERENEGDLIAAASLITAETIAFMAKEGSGLICLALTGEQLDRLNLPLMVAPTENTEQQRTAFTISIDAASGITTGISAADRARTILIASDPTSREKDLNKPGHIFPLRAAAHGVLERQGHTEAAVDLARLAGLPPAGVICEIMAADGTMLRGEALKKWAKEGQLPMITIAELRSYRLKESQQIREPIPNRAVLEVLAQCRLPTRHGLFDMTLYKNLYSNEEAIVLSKGTDFSRATVRIHSSCLSGDVFSSLRCDCGQQLAESLKQLVQTETGIFIYLQQEGRGIGLANKMRAYLLQERGLDTVEANLSLGFPMDARCYNLAIDILKYLHVEEIELLTNNPLKMAALAQHWPGDVLKRRNLHIKPSMDNEAYLKTKQEKMGHFLSGDVYA
ncbi:MAG: ribA [Gammaproteobacteria bacterium]|jgi:3,4-dihydroxy 2-butanone 4-phosphate synthase/GTP cyclohydrolase II|nr:ribA [Gammaproteobacteria bacterium]